MKTVLTLYLASYVIYTLSENYNNIRNFFRSHAPRYRVVIYRYNNGNRFVIHTTFISGKNEARRVGQELVHAMEGYEKSILTFEITPE
jgi:hypothetical protein